LSDAKVLAALARSPRGLASVRAVARRSGVSPTTAGRCLARLIRDGLATSAPDMIAAGRARRAQVFRASVTSPRWPEIAGQLARIALPAPGSIRRASEAVTVPYYLRHLFWNTAASQLDVATSAPYIARRLITIGDPDGLAWGVRVLPPQAWEHAARTRGLPPRSRQLARNIARQGHAAA
jgi:DNA-binding Lrp family transcriptional regulator